MNTKIKTLIVAAGLAVAALGTTAATAAPAEAKGAIVIKYKGGKKFGKFGYGYKPYYGYYGHRRYGLRCKPVFRYIRHFNHWHKKLVGYRCYRKYGYGYGY